MHITGYVQIDSHKDACTKINRGSIDLCKLGGGSITDQSGSIRVNRRSITKARGPIDPIDLIDTN